MLANLIRKVYDTYTLPLGRLCVRLGLSPDFLTLVSVLISILAGTLLAQGWFGWGLILVLLTNVSDMLDGATARAGGTANPFGGILDHVSDRYAEFFILTGILLSGRIEPVWVIFAIFGMVMASYVRAKAESIGKLKSCTVGLAGRQEKLILLMLGLAVEASPLNLPGLQWSLIAVGLISHITAIQRLIYSRKKIDVPLPQRDSVF